jgi:GYF domain 2
MFTIIGADGKEYGPVPAHKVQEWIAGGRANLQTKARRNGEADWKTLGDFPEFAPPTATPPPLESSVPAAVSSPDTGETAPVTPNIPFPTPAIPVVAAAPETRDPAAIAAEFNTRARPIDVFDCLGKSWNLWLANFLPLVGATLLVFVLQIVAGMIPFFGVVAGLVLTGVFYGGLYYFYLGKIRGEPREIGDVFAGFSRALAPLMLTNLLKTALSLAIFMPFFGAFCVYAVKIFMQAQTLGHPPDNIVAPSVGAMIGVALGIVPMVYFSIAWCFSFVLVIDKGLGPWTAMEVSRRVVTKQWFRVFFVLLFGYFLTLFGLLGFFIGILFTLPLMTGSLLYAYEDLFNPPRTS